jgi:hypothetical protein
MTSTVALETNIEPTINNFNLESFESLDQCSKYINSGFSKLIRYDSHLKILSTHIEAKTTPSSYFYNRFPRPFLQDDEEYIKDYNDLIGKFQLEAMNLNKKYLSARSNTINKNLEDIKAKFIDKDSTKILNETRNKIETSLKSLIDKNYNRALRTKAVPYSVSSSSQINDKSQSSTNTLNETPRSINRNLKTSNNHNSNNKKNYKSHSNAKRSRHEKSTPSNSLELSDSPIMVRSILKPRRDYNSVSNNKNTNYHANNNYQNKNHRNNRDNVPSNRRSVSSNRHDDLYK